MSHETARPMLTLVETYNGYVLAQGSSAMRSAGIRNAGLRAAAVAVMVLLSVLWLWPGAHLSADVVPLKLGFSAVLVSLAVVLLWITRGQPGFETRIDLIHGELRQVMGGAGGLTGGLLRLPLRDVESLFIRRNPDLPYAAGLYMRVRGSEEPALLGIGGADALETVHRRMSADLAKVRASAIRPVAPSESRNPGMAHAV